MNGFILDRHMVSHNVAEMVTSALVTTESDHTAIHKGYGYRGAFGVDNLLSGEEMAISLTTPPNTYVHFKNIVLNVLGSSATVELLDNVTITEDVGVLLALTNQNRNYPDNTLVEMRYTPVYTGGSVILDDVVLVDSTNQSVGSGQSSMSLYEEIVLKPDTTYILRLRNIDPSIELQSAKVRFFFYAEPSGTYLE